MKENECICACPEGARIWYHEAQICIFHGKILELSKICEDYAELPFHPGSAYVKIFYQLPRNFAAGQFEGFAMQQLTCTRTQWPSWCILGACAHAFWSNVNFAVH